ncbi:DUF5810 domain-containing protein [Haloferax namakaokahaiae]|uniref:DUF5810 domain-containing protein n=1 Tax=Haloferax namakaokahaiae TaxID=1748331 RepID=A0ABD5ZBY5_9EURY
MGYACPVCDAPQRDETHLANHLALQALVHGDDHEAWLDEHEPDWESMNADRLGPLVAEFAEEGEYGEVFEDTVDRRSGGSMGSAHGHGHGHDHTHSHPHGDEHAQSQPFGGESEQLTGDAADIFQEARRLTKEMQADETRTEAEESDDEDADETDKKES